MYATHQRLFREMEDSVHMLDPATYQMEDAAQWLCALQHRAMYNVSVDKATLEVGLARLDVFLGLREEEVKVLLYLIKEDQEEEIK